MDGAKPHSYEFGEFRLEPSTRRLLRGGQPVALTPKVFDTLVYLVEHRGAVLTKDDLLSALWPDVIVEENNLGQNISKLRSVLGEARGENRYIATVPGHGYRFVAAVREVAGDGADRRASAPPVLAASPQNVGFPIPPVAAARVSPSGQPAGRPGTSRYVRQAIIIGLVAGVVLLVSLRWRSSIGARRDAHVGTVAVLPFKPLVSGSRDEALEVGMADSLIAKLSNIRDLTVRPLGVVRRYSTPEQDPVSAGRELGVEAVLDGHIHRSADRIRVTVRLVRVADQTQLWAGQFDEQFTNIFGVQDAISERVTRALALELTGDEREQVVRRHTADAHAYELYLRGRFFMDLAQPRRAIELFEEAVGRDPGFAAAHAGLADIHSRIAIATDAPSREPMAKAKAAALKAIGIDDRLPEAYAALGWIDFYYAWDWRSSEANYQRALQLNPDDFSAHLGYAHLLSITSRHEQALREVDLALATEPQSPIASTLKGQFLFSARRYADAAEQLRSTLESHPAFWIALLHRGRLYERDGRYQEALAAFSRARESGGSWTPVALSGFTQAASGQRQAAERTLGEMRAAAERAYVPPYGFALVYQGLRDTDNALRWLERAYEDRDVRMVFLGVEPVWDSLRADPRFIGLSKRMNFPN
jgi:DNA-binding winged helix-turn-helix (wHTH) protein/TolB-like protein/Tfp pilus assembly protein PilF